MSDKYSAYGQNNIEINSIKIGKFAERR